MRLLQGGVALPIIALWLGNEDIKSTQIYVHADMRIKEAAMKRIGQLQVDLSTRDFIEDDSLLNFLESL